MKNQLKISLLFFACANLYIQLLAQSVYNDPNIAKPTTGYGADGSHPVTMETFTNPNFSSKNIEIYHPADIITPVPTIFYSHAYGGNISSNISGMLNFVASKGYAIVFVPYQTIGVTIQERYTNLQEGFEKAARDYPLIIDTTRAGFMGHSFGGGASFGIAHSLFNNNNWGSNGRFIYALAQWYSYNLSATDLTNFPADTKLLTEIFDNDSTNDHRMAIDIFEHINISDSEKDFILLKGDTINGYVYVADHLVPNTSAAFNALDYYAYYRFIDALADYTWNGNLNGKNVALGNGSPEQVTMPGGLKPLVETDDPVPMYPQSIYEFPCDSTLNPRQSYCSTLSVTEITQEKWKIYPNPAETTVTLITENPATYEISLFSADGRLLQQLNFYGTTTQVDVSGLQSGQYLISLKDQNQNTIQYKLMK